MSDLPFGNIFGDDVEATNVGTVPPAEFSIPALSSMTTTIKDFGKNFGTSTPSFSTAPPSMTTGIQGFGAPNAEPFLIPTEDDISEDEEFKLEAIFQDFTPIGIGSIKRIVPIGEWLLDDPSVKALKRNLDEMGITQVMPMVYANRVKHNIEKGYVQPDGSGFTEKGQQRAAEYLQYRYNQTSEQAMERASTARSLKIDQKRGDKAKGLNLKFGFGYQLDTIGRAVRN